MTAALPGVDDALALLFLAAHPHIDLRGVTAVAGNVKAEIAARDTLDVLAMAGARHVPVPQGAVRPLINEPHDARSVHGTNGLGGIELPCSATPLEPLTGPELIKRLIEESPEPITLLGLGPLTTIALFLRTFPDHAQRLDKIVFMGGSAGVGNATVVTEFNAWHDLEALAIVINSGLQVIIVRARRLLPAIRGARTDHRSDVIAEPPRQLAGRLLHFAAARDKDDPRLPYGATLGDAGAAYLLAEPDTVTVHNHPVQVQLNGPTRGQTIVDRRGFIGESEIHGLAETAPTFRIALQIDAERVVIGYLKTI